MGESGRYMEEDSDSEADVDDPQGGGGGGGEGGISSEGGISGGVEDEDEDVNGWTRDQLLNPK